jgi:pimeloyl-ACP methyl ester carboxylesterase
MTWCRVMKRNGLAAAIWSVFLAVSPAAADGVSAKRLYLDGQFGQIHVRTARPASQADEVKPPVALFHHTPGSSRLYEAVVPLLARDRLVLAFDTPGYGLSDRPITQPRIFDYAEALGEALATLVDGRPVDVVGHMTGSFIAVDIAVERPELVRKVVLSRSPVFTAETRARRLSEVQEQHAEEQADPTASYLVRRLERNLGSLALGASPEPVLVRFIDSVSAGEYWVFGELAVFRYRADLRMPKITQPTLFMTYDVDDARGPEWRQGAAIIRAATVADLSGLGAWAWQDHPAEMAARVQAFLDAD